MNIPSTRTISKQAVIDAINLLQDYLAGDNNPISFRIPSASTSEVSRITGQIYQWQSLRNYCLENNLEFHQVEVGRLTVNSYPAKAWYDVYGINLDTVFNI